MAMAMAAVAAHRCVPSDYISSSRVHLHRPPIFSKKCRRIQRYSTLRVVASGEDAMQQTNSAASVLPDNQPVKRPSPLEKGGTLKGEAAEGKDPSPAALGKQTSASVLAGKFEDPRWKNGTWDLTMFTKDGKVDWDRVIDAEVLRRKWLEENPEASTNEDPVLFDTATIPWWAWVRRFHLPEAELLNGRAAMLGFFAAYVVDSLTGIGVVDQTSSFFGKLFLFVTVVGVLLIRKNGDIETIKTLVTESTFYDKQWQATWKETAGTEEK